MVICRLENKKKAVKIPQRLHHLPFDPCQWHHTPTAESFHLVSQSVIESIYTHAVTSVNQQITYKLAVLTFKVRTTSMPTYLSHHIITCDSVRTLSPTTSIQLSEPFVRTDFTRRAFRFSAPHTWNVLPKTVRDSDSLGSFKLWLKTFLSAMRTTDSDMTCCQRLWSHDLTAL